MADEPVEVEVLIPVKALALVFAVLTALMILLVGLAAVLVQQGVPPKEPE